MKIISIKQPYASMIVSGNLNEMVLKQPITESPRHVLIHTGEIPIPLFDYSEPSDHVEDRMILENYALMGILPKWDKLPSNSIIGMAIIGNGDKLYDGRTLLKFADMKMFRGPIPAPELPVGFLEYEYTFDGNLPEIADIPTIQREGKVLRVPLNKGIYGNVKSGLCHEIEINILKENVAQLCSADDRYTPEETDEVVFFCDNDEVTLPVKSYAYFTNCYKSQSESDEPVEIEFIDRDGNERTWDFIRITF